MPTPLFAPSRSVQDHFRILIADDNDVFCAAFRGLLGVLGHAVEVATNGREAVEMASRSPFDIVFLDVQMPEMNGFEAADILRREHILSRRTRIIGLSAHSEYARIPAAAAMDDFLVKPIRLENLVNLLAVTA